MPTVQADRLEKIGVALLRAAGASSEEAEAVAGGCVEANLVGHDSHGIVAVPTYIDRIKAGHIVPRALFTIVQESPSTTVIRFSRLRTRPQCCAQFANRRLRLLLIDAHPRRFADPQDDSILIRAHGTGLRA